MSSDRRDAITNALLQQAAALDREDFNTYLASFAPDAEYRLLAYSPELGVDCAWLDLNREGLERLLSAAPRHVWNTGRRLHAISAPQLTETPEGVVSEATVVVYRSDDSGNTSLFAAGRYHDVWVALADGWRLARRDYRLDTRNLAPPSAIPL